MDPIWKQVIDADIKDAEYIPKPPLPDGEYDVDVTNVKTTVKAETGSAGVNVTYTIISGDHKGRDLPEYINIKLKNGSPNKRGIAEVKKLLLECGLTPKEILNFNFPEPGSTSFGDFKKLLDKPLTVSIRQETRKDGQLAGKSFPRVKSFRARAS